MEGRELESFDIIEENDEGLIVDRTIAFRPMPAAKLFRDAMRAAIGSAIPDDFWEYSIRTSVDRRYRSLRYRSVGKPFATDLTCRASDLRQSSSPMSAGCDLNH